MNKAKTRKIALFLVDMVACIIAFCFGMILWQEGKPDWQFVTTYTPLFISIQMLVFYLGGIYSILWRTADVEEALRTFLLCILGGFASLAINRLFHIGFSSSALLIVSMLIIVEMLGLRFGWRAICRRYIRFHPAQDPIDQSSPDQTLPSQPSPIQRILSRPSPTDPVFNTVMVVGAGEAGTYVINKLISDAKTAHQKIVLVDDDLNKQELRIRGIPILGTTEQIPGIAQIHQVTEIIIAIPSLSSERLMNLVTICNKTKCRVRVFRDRQQPNESGEGQILRELNVVDFLPREEVQLDAGMISGYLSGKRVLVTGGGGSIGSELCRQIVKYSPELLIIFDIYENCAYELEMELKHVLKVKCPILVLIGSVQDRPRMEEVFAGYKPEIVFHAAAYKHVPLMEISPAEAVKNNVFGTKTLLEVADRYKVQRFVLLSTDKAVKPTTAMGATKRIAEMLMQLYAKTSPMKCMAVRFGNVLGSHGSVIPLFDVQIKAGGPVTVTDPQVSRYFMTIPEAAQLVLEAGGMAQSGIIYLLDMGKPVRIVELAEQMIRFYGFEPGEDMKIVYTGLRAGEKLHEELLLEEERDSMRPTGNKKIFATLPNGLDEVLFREQLQKLRKIVFDSADEEPLFEEMAEIVGNYQYNRV